MTDSWTPERRAAQAARIRELKPWLKSTGPRTEDGKKRASQNALKHGARRAALRDARQALKLQREFMRLMLDSIHALDWAEARRPVQTNRRKDVGKTTDCTE